ncbi:DNA-binding transcriptional MerR regulator [Deinobacterium chartae]|uniref:DNA-binding transcriptional MerR regulator n=1 Tax=Deinobacterium chartae TaxID=521158 RepID=A0A841I827_9DEIO|nr:MerR family transcriptional regulator [Deinobacterium chartae]MBB6099955.1 DNA-binding transcriptional MerR regulator [Deinobacterium chartae]
MSKLRPDLSQDTARYRSPAPANLLPIGHFALLCDLSPRTLRFYDEQGLLRPEQVNPRSGYRMYASSQLWQAQLLRRLRDLEFSLEDMRAALSDPARLPELLEKQRRRLSERIERLERWLEGDGTAYAFALREVPAQRVASVRRWANYGALEQQAPRAFAEIYACLQRQGVSPAGPPSFLCHPTADFAGWCDFEAVVPVGADLEEDGEGNVRVSTLPAARVAYTLHPGDFQRLPAAYSALLAWIDQQELSLAGPACETYLVGMSDSTQMADWRTEVLWPVGPT